MTKGERITAIVKGLALFHSAGEVFEYRGIMTKGVLSGYFDNAFALGKQIVELEDRLKLKLKGSYFTIQKLKPEFRKRVKNKIEPAKTGESVSDADIERYQKLFLDIDPLRPADTNATIDEHSDALITALGVVRHLETLGFPLPIMIDSGNGIHLYIDIDLPNNPETVQLLKGCLEALAGKFNDDKVNIDIKVHNSARISKIAGTAVRKGEYSKKRPWSESKIMEVPKKREIASLETLEKLRDSGRKEGGKSDTKSEYDQKSKEGIKYNVEKLVKRHKIAVRGKPKHEPDGRIVYSIQCVHEPEHRKDPETGEVYWKANLTQHPDGNASYSCFGNRCDGKGMIDFLDEVDKGWRERPDFKQAKTAEEIEHLIEELKGLEGLDVQTAKVHEILTEVSFIKDRFIRETSLKKIKAITKVKLKTLESMLMDKWHKRRQEQAERAEPTEVNIDDLFNVKPLLHCAMELIDGALCIGATTGQESFYIGDKRIRNFREFDSKYTIPYDAPPLSVTPDVVKEYLNGSNLDAVKLLIEIVELLKGHVVFKNEWQVYIIAIWIMGTHLYRSFPLYPYILLQSPTKRCGKTRVLELISALGFNSDGVETCPTEAVLFRDPAIRGGILPWDEAENLTTKEKVEHRAILNVSYRKGGRVLRCEGDKHEVKRFEVYRPIALAGINYISDTTADRSLKIELIRKRRNDKVKRMHIVRMYKKLQPLRNKLFLFGLERSREIVEGYENFNDDYIVDDIDDRLRELFEVIIATTTGIFDTDKKDFSNAIAQIQHGMQVLGKVRASEETDVTFIRSIEIFKDFFESELQDKIIFTTGQATEFFQNNGFDWIEKNSQTQGILRKLGFHSDNNKVGGKSVRSYEILSKAIDDLWQRYGGM